MIMIIKEFIIKKKEFIIDELKLVLHNFNIIFFEILYHSFIYL